MEHAAEEWVSFPGDELEGKRPKALCGPCRATLNAGTRPRGGRTLCFQCYRADLARLRTLKAAGELDTASEARFQFQLPLEPLNRPRLDALRAQRAQVRAATPAPTDRRRQAQIEARHALHQIAAGVRARGLGAAAADAALFEAIRAAELQLPESWLPFVVAR